MLNKNLCCLLYKRIYRSTSEVANAFVSIGDISEQVFHVDTFRLIKESR